MSRNLHREGRFPGLSGSLLEDLQSSQEEDSPGEISDLSIFSGETSEEEKVPT